MRKNYEQNRKFCVVKVETLSLRLTMPLSQSINIQRVILTENQYKITQGVLLIAYANGVCKWRVHIWPPCS